MSDTVTEAPVVDTPTFVRCAEAIPDGGRCIFTGPHTQCIAKAADGTMSIRADGEWAPMDGAVPALPDREPEPEPEVTPMAPGPQMVVIATAAPEPVDDVRP